MYQGWLWYVKELLRYGLTSGLAAALQNLIGFSGQTVLNLTNLFDVFHQGWPEDHVCQVSRWLDKICDRSSILKVFDINQDGGKSIIAQNDDIRCVELVLAQGIQWYLVCEYWMNGSKVINMNACATLTCWWRQSCWASDLKLACCANGAVLNKCAKFRNFSPSGSMGCHRLPWQRNNNKNSYNNNRLSRNIVAWHPIHTKTIGCLAT